MLPIVTHFPYTTLFRSHSEQGIDVSHALRHMQEHGRLAGLRGTQPVDGQAMLELPCDILIPAALEGQLTHSNAPRIQAKDRKSTRLNSSHMSISYAVFC